MSDDDDNNYYDENAYEENDTEDIPVDYEFYEQNPDAPKIGFKEAHGETSRFNTFNTFNDQLGGLDSGIYIGRYKTISPDQYFLERVKEIVRFDGLTDLRDEDKHIIVDKIDEMNWIQNKIPSMYILGYILARHDFKNVKEIESIIKKKYPTNALMDAVRYGRYWQKILKINTKK